MYKGLGMSVAVARPRVVRPDNSIGKIGCATRKTKGNLKCIVLDLDETLINTRSGKAERLVVQKALRERGETDRYYEFKLGNQIYWGVKRAYYAYFLAWAFSTFDIVGVWTAAEFDYATAVIDATFPEQPHFIWSRDDCVKSSGLFYKPLSKLFSRFPQLDIDNTIIVDDRSDIAQYNPSMLVEVPAFNYKNPLTYDRTLIVLLTKIRDWLNGDETLRATNKTDIEW